MTPPKLELRRRGARATRGFKTLIPLVTKLQLGDAVVREAPASSVTVQVV